MAESEQKPATPDKPKKSGALLGIVLPAIFAAGAAFGGARLAAGPKVAHAETPAASKPGPTLALDPFLVNTVDASHKPHPMKVSLAIEFDASTKEDSLKPLVPRVRDAVLTYLRTLSTEEVADPQHSEKMRAEILERIRHAAGGGAQKVLVTDMVIQ